MRRTHGCLEFPRYLPPCFPPCHPRVSRRQSFDDRQRRSASSVVERQDCRLVDLIPQPKIACHDFTQLALKCVAVALVEEVTHEVEHHPVEPVALEAKERRERETRHAMDEIEPRHVAGCVDDADHRRWQSSVEAARVELLIERVQHCLALMDGLAVDSFEVNNVR